MNRKAISILAILALLCTMFTFAMPTTAETTATEEDYKKYPKYALHENYPGETNWTIQDDADWEAMRKTAEKVDEKAEYLKGETFHLIQDVDFSQTGWLKPIGAKRYFSGTINGHENGFNNFKIYDAVGRNGSTSGDCAVGMFYRLGDCSFIDFGINSGTIINASEDEASSATTFGGLADDDWVKKDGEEESKPTITYTPTFTRVWSGATLVHTSTGTVSALAAPGLIKNGGTPGDDYTQPFKVNGFVFDGRIINQGKDAFSVLGSLPEMVIKNSSGVTRDAWRDIKSVYTLTNIITDAKLLKPVSGSPTGPTLNGNISTEAGATYDPRVTTASVAPSVYEQYEQNFEENYDQLHGNETAPLPAYSMLFSAASISGSVFENLYTVSYPNVRSYLGRTGKTGARTENETMMAESALEAAWKTNKNPSKEAEQVYFTLKNGKIRPTDDSKNMIVKVTLTGIKDEVLYLNANTTYTDLEKALNKKALQNLEVIEGTATLSNGQLQLKGGDVTINVTTDCGHPSEKARYSYTENAHIKTCDDCGFSKEMPCSAASDYIINPIDLAAGKKATHSGTCQFCDEDFTLECTVSYVPSTEYNTEAYWDYSGCVCGRGNIVHTDTAKVLCGDVDGDASVDLTDAVLILREYVQLGEIDKVRNADVNGDGEHNMDDVILTVQRWLGNTKAKTTAAQAEKRFNENLFNPDAVTEQSLKMDGTDGDVDGYVVSNPIAVHSGEKLSFGPVRLSAPVIGYFYSKNNQALQLINHTNVKVVYTFEEGKALVSVDVPANAETVRFQMATEEAKQFYLRVNTEITGMDYEKHLSIESSTIDNPLKGRTLLTVGDSLCAAANDVEVDDLKGWARRIHQNFGANVTNSAKGGSSLSTAARDSKDGTATHYIYNQLDQHSGKKNFDYILLEGGVNDSRINVLNQTNPDDYVPAPTGTFRPETDPNAYDPAYFDAATTMAGGMERLIYKAIQEHGDTAAFGYVGLYSMRHSTGGFEFSKEHLETAMAICRKWGIKYVDFYNERPYGFSSIADAHTSDDCHANTDGYDLMQPRIDQLCLEMRPISQEIYNEVHKDRGFDITEGGGPLNTAEENPYKDSLKILAIGNSFSQDATVYIWGIANSYGVKNVVVENLSIGSCSLDKHYQNITNDTAGYEYYKWTSANGGKSVNGENKSIAQALAEEDWDIITVQQASGENRVFNNPDLEKKYDPNAGYEEVDTYSKLDEIIAYLQENEPNAKILWHMTWAYGVGKTHKAFEAYGYDQMVMYNSLLDRAQDLTEEHDALEGVLPSGTAIQNLRGLGVIDSAKSGATITRDGYHLNKGIGRYTAALTWYCYITGADPREVSYIPDNEYEADIETYRSAIAEAAYNAIRNPYKK